jgi:hypothetical protein
MSNPTIDANSLTRGDLVVIATARGVAHTSAALWKMRRDELVAAASPATASPAALARLAEARTARAAWAASNPAKTAAGLAAAVREIGAPAARLRDRDGLIDALVAAGRPAAGRPAAGPAGDGGADGGAFADMYGGASASAAAEEAEAVAVPEPPLDADQAAAVERWDAPRLLISAGPGAGKTTTVCRLVRRALSERPRDRVLVLAYNIEAGRVLGERIARGTAGAGAIPVISLGRDASARRVTDPNASGVAVMTFHQYAGHVDRYYASATAAAGSIAESAAKSDPASFDDMYGADAATPAAEMAEIAEPVATATTAAMTAAPAVVPAAAAAPYSFDRSIALAAKHIAESGVPAGFDLLVVDEAQDVMANLALLVDSLVGAAGRGERPLRCIVAGDPRQELYAGAVWFSSLWAAAPTAERVTLRTNHRSAPAIVDLLNKFSRANFPQLHVDQIAGRQSEAVEPSPSKQPVRIVWVQVGSGKKAGAPGAPAVHKCYYQPPWHEATRSVGEVVGRIVAESQPGDAYAITPCTIGKYHMEPATKRAREEIYRARPGARVVAADDDAGAAGTAHTAGSANLAVIAGSYSVATSTRLKGTERPRVVVFGCDLDYGVLTRPALIKRLFVALSRARDELVIVVRTQMEPIAHQALAPILQIPVAIGMPPAAPVDRDRPRRVLKLTVDVAGCEAIRVAARAWPGASRPPVLAVPVESDADFVGGYVEALVASALGLVLATRAEVFPIKRNETESVMKYYDRATGESYYKIRCHTGRAAAVRTQINVAAAAAAAHGGDSAYLHCMLGFCATIGTAWTVSERLAHATATFAPQAAAIADWLRVAAPGAIWEWGECRVHELWPERAVPGSAAASNAASSGDFDEHRAPVLLAYEPDFVARDPATGRIRLVVEHKHVTALSDTHRRQTAMYATMIDAGRAMLFNASDGTAEIITPVSQREFARTVRAIAAIGAGRGAAAVRSAHGPAASFPGIATPPGFTPACVIALDIETDTVGGTTVVTEVGAVAFSAVDSRVLGTWSELAPGVSLAAPGVSHVTHSTHKFHKSRLLHKSHSHAETITGLAVTDGAALAAAQPSLRARLLAWADGLAPARTWAVFGGSDAAWLNNSSNASLPGAEQDFDVLHHAFRPWRERVAGTADPASLERAAAIVTDCVGTTQVQFAPHIAFEDAIATAAVFAAVMRTDGEL